jgi:hypothetical protein
MLVLVKSTITVQCTKKPHSNESKNDSYSEREGCKNKRVSVINKF